MRFCHLNVVYLTLDQTVWMGGKMLSEVVVERTTVRVPGSLTAPQPYDVTQIRFCQTLRKT
jgi:hypothetical protein